jgi:hypothetical protein
LQRPTPGEPSTLTKGRIRCIRRLIAARNVAKVREALPCILIPFEHRIDCLRQLGAARLVNAASVDPDVSVAHGSGKRAATPDLEITSHVDNVMALEILK